MNVDPAPDATGRPRLSRRGALLAVAGAAALVGASGWYRQRAVRSDPIRTALDLHAAPRPAPDLRFADGSGASHRLSEFRGRAVLLNVWATWCPPCREEMPTLDRLQAALGGAGFEVVTVSIDAEGLPVVETFFRQMNVAHLRPYVDSFGDVAPLGATGVPLTLLIDAEGREVARKRGPATWDDPQIVQTIRRFIPAMPA